MINLYTLSQLCAAYGTDTANPNLKPQFTSGTSVNNTNSWSVFCIFQSI